MKTLHEHFIDWESTTFGYGYGTGEPFVIHALKRFMDSIENGRCYDYEHLEAVLTPTVAWLLINVLAHADIIEYGSSPRFGWLTEYGTALAAYMKDKPTTSLLDVLERDYEGHCYPDHCNCAEECHNLFWREITPRGRSNVSAPPAPSDAVQPSSPEDGATATWRSARG